MVGQRLRARQALRRRPAARPGAPALHRGRRSPDAASVTRRRDVDRLDIDVQQRAVADPRFVFDLDRVVAEPDDQVGRLQSARAAPVGRRARCSRATADGLRRSGPWPWSWWRTAGCGARRTGAAGADRACASPMSRCTATGRLAAREQFAGTRDRLRPVPAERCWPACSGAEQPHAPAPAPTSSGRSRCTGPCGSLSASASACATVSRDRPRFAAAASPW